MADEKKKRKPLTQRPRLLLFCLYLAAYGAMRVCGEIVSQDVPVQGGGFGGREYVVGANPMIPRWRRQTYRAVFALPMVCEEELRRNLPDSGELFQDLVDFVRSYLPK